MLFEPRQHPFLSIQASCRTGFKRTVPGLLKLSRFEPTRLARVDSHVWRVVLQKHHKLQPKRKTTDELKAALQTTWEKLLQDHINKAMANFTKRSTA